MITKEQLFRSLADGWPNSPYSLPNDYKDFDNDVIWHDENSLKPKLSEIEDHYKSIQYLDDRRINYPSIEDQLDLLYHVGIDGWKEIIKKVKDKFPKP